MKQYKILVVDDEDYIVELVKFNLEKEGYQVIVANDGRSALNMDFRLNIPDLILLDIMLPNVGRFRGMPDLKSRAQLPIRYR